MREPWRPFFFLVARPISTACCGVTLAASRERRPEAPYQLSVAYIFKRGRSLALRQRGPASVPTNSRSLAPTTGTSSCHPERGQLGTNARINGAGRAGKVAERVRHRTDRISRIE